ncbi:MAG: hypothetical protein ACYS32_00460 [Planctomycetota bacterium]|jgi:hypothetical protein
MSININLLCTECGEELVAHYAAASSALLEHMVKGSCIFKIEPCECVTRKPNGPIVMDYDDIIEEFQVMITIKEGS